MGIGGLFSAAFNPASLLQLAAGPAGWASLAVRTIGTQMAMGVISQVGQQLGLPQSAIRTAVSAFSSSIGMPGLTAQPLNQVIRQFTQAANMSPFQAAQFERSVKQEAATFTDILMDGLKASSSATRRRPVGGAAGQSFLVEIALTLGNIMDQKLNKMYTLSKELGNMSTKDSQYGAKTAELQAVGKELDFVSQALNNSLKSIGEAASQVARKN